MPEQLQVLKALQTLDRERRELIQQREQLDEEQGRLQVEVDRVQAMVDSLTSAIEARQEERRELLGKLEHERGLASRAEGRLPQIKTQREYLAVLKEVDAAKKQIKELNDQVAAKDRDLEALTADKGEKDAELAALSEQTAARQAEISAVAVGLDAGLADHGRQRDSLTGRLPVALRKRYDMLLDRRNGLAVVEARDGACLGCHMHLPPQLFNRLYVAKEVQSCPHCNRLLYLAAE
ncbi:MAG: C4-type zinc ribbon domain-containing protein [Desulfuromonadales bacterium]|nr:C4-type zinc ribbon domain-containing protein [Desulfuromonadales bacterium]